MRRIIARWGHGLIAMSFVFCAVPPASAASAPGLQVTLGIGGWVVPGTFTPLRLDIGASRNLEGTVTVSVPGPGRDPGMTYVHALRVIPGARQQIALDVIVQDPRRAVTVEARAGGAVLTRLEVPVGAARTAEGVVVALTREAAGLEFLAVGPRRLRPAYVTEAALPSRWQSYGGVELVAIRDLDPRALLPPQQQALVDWVAQGGRLLLIPHASLVIPPWLRALLPAGVHADAAVRAAGVPVPLRRLVPGPAASVMRAGGVPIAVRGQYGRGAVEVWAFDALAPQARGWPGGVALWRALLDEPREVPVVQPGLAEELPQTRPLPGSTQAVLAVLSVAYIVTLRALLRRWGVSRGGSVLVAAAVAVFALILYTLAAGARSAASSIAQVSVVEVLPGAQRARVTTYVSLITPYGGEVTLRLPGDALARPLTSFPLRIAEPAHTVTGGAPSGRLALEVTQVVSLDLRARARSEQGTLVLAIDGAAARRPRDALLYRARQIYRFGSGSMPGRVRLDPARWEPLGRTAAAGTDLTSRTLAWLLPRLDGAGDGHLWLAGAVADDRLPVRLPDGRPGEAAQVLVLPLPVR